jgi:pentatricopeptide repeat protein
MNVAIKSGQLHRALEVYQDMLRAGCTPNVRVLPMWHGSGMREARQSATVQWLYRGSVQAETHMDMHRLCCRHNQTQRNATQVVTYNTLIDVYGKTGQWAEALRVLDTMHASNSTPVTRTYNTLMIACNTSGQWQEALNVYADMLARRQQPNTTTYNALISAHSKAGRLEKVCCVCVCVCVWVVVVVVCVWVDVCMHAHEQQCSCVRACVHAYGRQRACATLHVARAACVQPACCRAAMRRPDSAPTSLVGTHMHTHPKTHGHTHTHTGHGGVPGDAADRLRAQRHHLLCAHQRVRKGGALAARAQPLQRDAARALHAKRDNLQQPDHGVRAGVFRGVRRRGLVGGVVLVGGALRVQQSGGAEACTLLGAAHPLEPLAFLQPQRTTNRARSGPKLPRCSSRCGPTTAGRTW